MGPPPAGLKELEDLFARIISLSVGLSFIALFVMLIVSGIKFLTSGGEPKALQAAGQSLTWALLGILFLAVAWLILQLIATFVGIPGLTGFDLSTLCSNLPNFPTCPPAKP